MFSVICARVNGLVNNGGAGDLRRYRVHYDVTVMQRPANVETLSLWYIMQYRDLLNRDISRMSGITYLTYKTLIDNICISL